MSYPRTLIVVVVTPEGQQLLDRAVPIACPVNARISLVTLVSDPELRNQFVASTLENPREAMQEEARDFVDKLSKEAKYPVEHTFIAYGALNEHILDVRYKHVIDLVIYGNHNHSFFSCVSYLAESVIHTGQVNALLVPLAGDQSTVLRLHVSLEQEGILPGS